MGRNKAILLLLVAILNIIWAAQTQSLGKTTLKHVKRDPLKVKKGSLRNDYSSDDAGASAAADSGSASDVQENAGGKHDLNEESIEHRHEEQRAYDNEDTRERPLASGDIFTAAEMLPVAEKLRAKVEEPGMGKGIVSSAPTSYHLADKLFEQFFLTRSRFVTLTAYDIIGLDALQALALSGEPANLRTYYVEVTSPRSTTIIDFHGQDIVVKTGIKRSKYRLLTKNGKSKVQAELLKKVQANKKDDEATKIAKAKKFLRHALKAIHSGKNITHLKQRLNATINHKGEKKNPKLADTKVVQGKKIKPVKNGLRKEAKPTQAKPVGPAKTMSKNIIDKSKTLKQGEEKKPVCRWKYECTNPNNLDSCHLKTTCDNQYRKHARKDNIDALGISHRPDEHTQHIQQFRKMIGLSLVDEEVEKILETRIINLRPPRRGKELEKLESLSEYFNNIVMAQARKSTVPYTGDNNRNPRVNPESEQSAHDSQSASESSEGEYKFHNESGEALEAPDILRRNIAKTTPQLSATMKPRKAVA